GRQAQLALEGELPPEAGEHRTDRQRGYLCAAHGRHHVLWSPGPAGWMHRVTARHLSVTDPGRRPARLNWQGRTHLVGCTPVPGGPPAPGGRRGRAKGEGDEG